MIIFITTFKANYYGTKTTGKPAGVAEKCKIGMPMVATIATISRRTTRIPMQAKRPSLRVDKKNRSATSITSKSRHIDPYHKQNC